MPPLVGEGLWPNQRRGVEQLEESLKADRPRALIQMATGSGKTILAVTEAYRLVKLAGARRVLSLVDRTDLGQQAEKEFQNYRTPDDKRKFTELYNVQRLTGNTIGSSAKVVITTIQRLYSMLRGDADLDAALEEGSQFEVGRSTRQGRRRARRHAARGGGRRGGARGGAAGLRGDGRCDSRLPSPRGGNREIFVRLVPLSGVA